MFCAFVEVLTGSWCGVLGVVLKSIPNMRRLDFPMFLLRVGLFTFIDMDSLIALAKPCLTLPTMLRLSSLVDQPVMKVLLCIL